jgi:hypothetical protein
MAAAREHRQSPVVQGTVGSKTRQSKVPGQGSWASQSDAVRTNAGSSREGPPDGVHDDAGDEQLGEPGLNQQLSSQLAGLKRRAKIRHSIA